MLARCHGRCVAAAARAARGRLWAPCWRTGWGAGGRGLGTAAEGGSAAAEEGLSVAGRVLLFAPAVITLGLGSWQLDRLQWKYGQIELRAKLLSSAPERITSAQGLLGLWARLDPGQGGQEFAPFTLRGRFDHAQEVYVGLRGKPGAPEEALTNYERHKRRFLGTEAACRDAGIGFVPVAGASQDVVQAGQRLRLLAGPG